MSRSLSNPMHAPRPRHLVLRIEQVCLDPSSDFSAAIAKFIDNHALTTYAALDDDMIETGEGAPLEWHERWRQFAVAIEAAVESIVRADGSTPESFFLSLNGMQQAGGAAGGAAVSRFLGMMVAA
jgi:hypothetical protein